jgi:hypothetical protein
MSEQVSDQPSSNTNDPTTLTPTIGETPAPESTGSAGPDSIDPITGGAVDGTGYSTTSNGNEIVIALGSTIDSSTNLNVTNNYITYQTYQTYQNMVANNPAATTTPAAASTPSSPAQDSNSLRRSGHRYIFNSKEYFSSNVKQRRVDRILNFSPSDGDALALSRKRFSGIDKLDFTQVDTKKELKSAARGDFDVIYLEPRGELYFNQNADARGFGRGGGLFAILETAPSISSEQFMLM